MKWSTQQEAALKRCREWVKDPYGRQVFYLAGFAGTGKTTLAKYLVGQEPHGSWLFASYTGKASHVLRQKGCSGATTIHSLIYKPSGETKMMEINELEYKILELERIALERPLNDGETNKLKFLTKSKEDLQKENRPRFSVWRGSQLGDYNVKGIVIDEVSMVDEKVGRDLESFDKKILVLGDPAQLPPVGAGGYYTKRKPDVLLTEVHRHAKDSGILRLATIIREGGSLSDFQSTNDVRIFDSISKSDLLKIVMKSDQLLVGKNSTRCAMNFRYREVIGCGSEFPVVNDRLVCLKNDHTLGLFNGSQWVVKGSDPCVEAMTTWLHVRGEDTEGTVEVDSWLHHMLGRGEELFKLGFQRKDCAEFDWSYALTVHKSQGSQWDDVVLFDQSKSFRSDARKWLYTGITRASKRLTIVKGF